MFSTSSRPKPPSFLRMKRSLGAFIVSMCIFIIGGNAVLADSLNSRDMAFAFGSSPAASDAPLELAALSDQEMIETEGEWVSLVVRGGLVASKYCVRYCKKTWGIVRNFRMNVKYDRKPHRFTSGIFRGNRSHFQINTWQRGSRGSHRNYRIPASKRKAWGSHRR